MSSSEVIDNESKHKPTRHDTKLVYVGRLFGAVGLVLWVSALLTWFMIEGLGPMVWAKLVFGAVAIAFYLVTNPDFFTRLAGARSTGLMVMTVASVLIVVGLVGAGNYVAFKHPKQWDLTREGIYTLSKQTQGVLKRLKGDVKVSAFYSSADPDIDKVTDLMQRYAAKSSHFKWAIVDPQNRPDLVKKYQISSNGPRIVVTAGGKDTRVKDPTEEDLTNAIIKVAQQKRETVYFLTGHGERDLEDGTNAVGYKKVADGIRAEGYNVKTLSLTRPTAKPTAGAKLTAAQTSGKLEVPKKVKILIIADPRGPLMPAEVDAVSQFLDRGGRLIVLLEPDRTTNLEPLLTLWKIKPQNDIIADQIGQLVGLGWAGAVVGPTNPPQEIVKNMVTSAVMLTARSLKIIPGGKPGVDAKPLVQTGDSAWGETHPVNGLPQYDDKDIQPPLVVAAVATKGSAKADNDEAKGDAAEKNETRLVVFGDADFISNRLWLQQGNSDLFLNSLNWAAAQDQKITIRPKKRAANQLSLSVADLGYLKFFSMDIVPVLLVALGLGVVLIRRQR